MGLMDLISEAIKPKPHSDLKGKCPKCKGLFVLGEQNSTITFSPFNSALWPYFFPCFKMEGSVLLASESCNTKKFRYGPLA